MNPIYPESPYLHFDRNKWSKLRNNEPMTLSPEEVITLKGINEEFSVQEVEEVYLPLARLISYYVDAQNNRKNVLMKFLNQKKENIPFIIGVSGSVSVGKSTTARVLQALLSRRPEQKNVSLVNTDGFLYPNEVLEERKIMHRKGFPESYDTQSLMKFINDIKSGTPNVEVPLYSHQTYDILPDKKQMIEQSDILIIEGVNVLQNIQYASEAEFKTSLFDFLDFSIYVDANESDLEEWYVSRFMKFRKSAFQDPNSYFHDFAKLSKTTAETLAKNIWYTINRENLLNNILPSRERANLIIHKGENHIVDYVNLRK